MKTVTPSRWLIRIVALSLSASALFISPFVSAESTRHSAASQNMPHATTGTHMSGGMDMKSMMKDDMDKMASMQMSGNPDVDFAMMMREHHLSGIKMAEMELRDGKEPKMRTMAKSIIATQKKEIAKFDQFLAKHGHAAKPGKQ